MQVAIEKLSAFIESSENNIVEKMILLKLKAYADRTNLDEEALKELEEEKKKTGFSKNIDEILEELKLQIPIRNNIVKTSKRDYTEVVKRYEEEIRKNPLSTNARNILAFAYFKTGKIDEARNELLYLIEQKSNHTSYRQMIHLEKCEGNYDDAKLWAYECIDKFPESIAAREQLISMAREENDNKEIIRLLKEIIDINPQSNKDRERLKLIESVDER